MTSREYTNEPQMEQRLHQMKEGRFQRFFWPTLRNAEEAKKASRHGAWCASFVGSITAIVVTLNLAGMTHVPDVDATAYLDASLFLVLAYFMFKLSRAAAVTALALFVLEQVYKIAATNGSVHGMGILPILFVFFFVNAIRGTFAHQRFTSNSTPVTEQPRSDRTTTGLRAA